MTNRIDRAIDAMDEITNQVPLVAAPEASGSGATQSAPLPTPNVGGEPRRAESATGWQREPSGRSERVSPTAEMPTPPIPNSGARVPDLRTWHRTKTYTADVSWDPINKEWYGLCALCKELLGPIDESDIGHFVSCDGCGTDNFIEREEV
jgi:hypothetical protein